MLYLASGYFCYCFFVFLFCVAILLFFVCFCFVFQNTAVMVVQAGSPVTILEFVSHITAAFARVTREHILVIEHVKVSVCVVYFINIINET